jgi:hypothetical protein
VPRGATAGRRRLILLSDRELEPHFVYDGRRRSLKSTRQRFRSKISPTRRMNFISIRNRRPFHNHIPQESWWNVQS